MRQHWSALEALAEANVLNIYDIHHPVEDKKARFSLLALQHSTWYDENAEQALAHRVNDQAGNTMVTIRQPGWGTSKCA